MSSNFTIGPSEEYGSKRAQHKSYLLKAPYRVMSLSNIYDGGEQDAIDFFAKIRWGEIGRQACPRCGELAQHYWTARYKRWKCRACEKQFTVFSDTYLHATKLKPVTLLSLFFHFVEAKDSVSAREVSGLHKLNHQTTHVTYLKLREAIRASMLKEPLLTGKVQADAAYFIKYLRPGNTGTGPSFAAQQKQKNAGLDESAKAPRQAHHPDMHALVVFVQAGAQGHRHYKIARIKTETQVDLLDIGQNFCASAATLTTDQHSGYDLLTGAVAEHRVINHRQHFQDEHGNNTNLAEGFFSRLRHAYRGAWHRTSVQYLELYGWEFAWRLTMVGASNDEQLKDLLTRLLTQTRPPDLIDYWRKKPGAPPADPNEAGMLVEIPKNDVPKRRGRPVKSPLRKKAEPRKKRRYNKKCSADVPSSDNRPT
jgi:transposase-like protein